MPNTTRKTTLTGAAVCTTMLLLTGCSQGADPTADNPALDSAPIVSLLPSHAEIDKAIGKDLPYVQEPREIPSLQDSNQPSAGTPCDLAEYSTGHPDSSAEAQVMVGADHTTVLIEVFRFPAVGSATRFVKTAASLQDNCAPRKKSGITSWTSRQAGLISWIDNGQPHALFQRGAVVGYVASSTEEDAAKAAKLLSDTMDNFK